MEQRVKRLVGHTDQLLGCFLGLKQKYAFLQPMIADEQVARRHGSGMKTEGFEVIRQSLFCDCVQDVVKLSLDKDKRTPSIANIMEEVSREEVRQSLREVLRAAIKRWDADVQEQQSIIFDEKYKTLLSNWGNFQKQPWLNGFKAVRDKLTAHLELKIMDGKYSPIDVSKLGLKWGDLGKSLDLLQPIVLGLNLIVRKSSFGMDDLELSLKHSASAFWS
ncbi:MAG: hypothetical protein ABSH14_04335 [Verrucomicrobiia bacterium]|jgi:hypothetical protein